MAGLDELAARLRRADELVRSRCALDAARAGGHAYLRQLQRNTPVLTGTLRRSERLDSVRGGGLRATAEIGAHTVYARFRETGGTIRVVRAKVLTDGVRFFGKQVTQEGSEYFARTTAWAEGGGLDGPVRRAVDGILREAGL